MSEDLNNLSNSPVFIVGTPRSGTTLMASVLGRNSNLFIEGEFHFFDDIYSKKNVFGNPSQPKNFETIYNKLLTHYRRFNFFNDQRRVERIFASISNRDRMQAECKSYKDIFSFFMNIQARESGKTRWGNQVPRDLFNLHTILRFYPDAKIIICIRDIRDFLLSYKYKWRQTSLNNIMRLKTMYHPVVTSLLWKLSIRKIADVTQKINKNNFLIIRYEDLVKDPEQSIRHICKTIDENFEYQMLDIDSENSSFSSPKGIFKTSVGRWKAGLLAEEAVIAQFIGGKDLINSGYTKAHIAFNPRKLMAIISSTPIAFVKALRASTALRGPLLPYLKKRLGI
jgi:hypothetical protein